VVPQLDHFKQRHPIYGISSPVLSLITNKKAKRKSQPEAEQLDSSPASGKKKKKLR
jgi:hypothetical protein